MCFRGSGVAVWRVPGQGRSMPVIPELKGCGVFGNWRKESGWSREGQGGWKVRTRHQTSEDKSRILQGLECNVRGFRSYCQEGWALSNFTYLCFRIIWKQTGRMNCIWLQLRQEDLWGAYSGHWAGLQQCPELGWSCATGGTDQVWGERWAMELGMAGSGPLGNRNLQFQCEPDTSQCFTDRHVLSFQSVPFLFWKACRNRQIYLKVQVRPDIFALTLVKLLDVYERLLGRYMKSEWLRSLSHWANSFLGNSDK